MTRSTSFSQSETSRSGSRGRGGSAGGLALARLLLERPGATMREAAIARRNGS